MWKNNQIDNSSGSSHLSAWQGSGEERTESYIQYGEGAPESLTQSGAKSSGRVTGSASQQADAVRRAQGISEKTGFPNAATDSSLSSLDLAKLLIQNPSSTFFMRLRGNTWEDRGIFDGDVVVIDRALVAHKTDLVIWWGGEAFAIGKPHHVPEGVEVWGVVTTVIHQTRKKS